jgi:hypothetical protein
MRIWLASCPFTMCKITNEVPSFMRIQLNTIFSHNFSQLNSSSTPAHPLSVKWVTCPARSAWQWHHWVLIFINFVTSHFHWIMTHYSLLLFFNAVHYTIKSNCTTWFFLLSDCWIFHISLTIFILKIFMSQTFLIVTYSFLNFL